MARKLFVDTWGWLTLRDRQESRHQVAVNIYNQLRAQAATIYTTDYVLDETFTLLFKRLPLHQAQESINLLMDSARAGQIVLEWITPERFEATRQLRQKFHDKPNISFTYLTSMVVMNEMSILSILTGDAHFTHVGLGFQLIP
jgi:predicted nucleic acid-binding protein